jgi:hypothetical protein
LTVPDNVGAGTYNTTVSVGNTDADEHPFDLPLTAVVAAAPQFQIIDDGDAGFTATSGFSPYNLSGRDGDIHYANIGGQDTASWKFTNLVDGVYDVAVTYTVAAFRPNAAPYTIKDANGVVLDVVEVNQAQPPSDFDAEGSSWKTLGTINVTDGVVEVILANQGSGRWFIADAAWINKVGNIVLAPEISVKLDGTELTDNSAVDLGSIIEGVATTYTFTVKNVGTSVLGLTQIDASGFPAWLELTNQLVATTLAAGATTTFALTVPDNVGAGTYNTTVSVGNTDADENPFDLPLTAEVALYERIIDDGDAGFTATSGFSSYITTSGHNGDIHYANIGGQDTASYAFTNLVDGGYRLAVTWTVAAYRPTNAPYTIKDANGVVLDEVEVDQTQQPDDFQLGGTWWAVLGNYADVTGTLEVTLTNQGSGKWFIADAVLANRIIGT